MIAVAPAPAVTGAENVREKSVPSTVAVTTIVATVPSASAGTSLHVTVSAASKVCVPTSSPP